MSLVFVVDHPKGIYVFDNHDAALQCRIHLKLNQDHLTGCGIASGWNKGQPVYINNERDKIVPLPYSKKPIPVNLPEGDGPPVGFGSEDGRLDNEAFFNMRAWLQDAIVAKGATVWGAGIGCGQADISFDLDGFGYNVSIRPSRVSSNGDGLPRNPEGNRPSD